MDHSIHVIKRLLSLLAIKHTSRYLKDSILSHPDHNSLLAITDTLDNYNIENLAVKIDAEKLTDMPLPCIVQVKAHGSALFCVLDALSDTKVSYYDNNDKLTTIEKEAFLKIWTGVCLLVETTEASKEPDIEKKLADKRIFNLLGLSVIFLLAFWIVFSFHNATTSLSILSTIYTGIFTILKIIGLTVGIILLWFEIDQYNPTLQSFCTGSSNSKINCNAVLGSKYAMLFNGSLSLSLLVFAYFFSTLGYVLISQFSTSALSTLSVFSFLSLPALIASVYYQAFVIKQWCKFCIIVQIIILAEIAIAFFSESYKTLEIIDLPLLGALFLMPIIGWKFLKPLLENQKTLNLNKRGLKKLKNNPDVLEGLLQKSRKIETSTEGLGISINNETAKYHIIKVCNPYCSPCAKAQPVLEHLVHAGKISLQVLFTANADGKDIKAKPVSHFLAIDEQKDKSKTQQALDDWYHAEIYPMNGELEKQSHKIEAMRNWCDLENITYTPTIFINGYELPKEYSIEDLREVLQ